MTDTSSAGDGFTVRCVDSAEDLCFIREQAVKAGWMPGNRDVEAYYGFDPSGFFIGELDGTKVSCIAVIKFNEKYSFLKFYIVDKAHRGKGYGIRTFRAGMASIVGACSNTALDGDLHLAHVPLYEKSGFIHCGLTICQYLIACPKVIHSFSEVCPAAESYSTICIRPINEVDFEKLAAFDCSIFPIQRHSFLEKWISAELGLGWAAVTQTGEVLGYMVVRRTLCQSDQQHTWKLRPLFAESVSIAKALLNTAARVISAKTPDEKIIINVPLEGNIRALEIIEELEGKEVCKLKRLFTEQVLQPLIEKVYSIIA